MTAGRPVEFDQDAVLGAAMNLFWTRGYAATSMQDLLAATKLSKSSLYQAFGSKQQIFERCIARYTEQMVAQLRARLDGSASALEFVRTTLAEIAREGRVRAAPRGCLIMNTAAEFGQREPDFAGWVDVGIARIRAVMELACKRGQEAGEFTRKRSAPLLADYLMSSIAGLRTLVKAGTRPKTLRDIVDVIVCSVR